MRREPDEITLADYRRLTKGQRKREKKPRPDIPRAEPTERDGFTVLTRERGWSSQSPDANRYRLYQLHTGLDTGLCDTAALACERARRLEGR